MSKERKFPPLIISPSSLADKNQPLLSPDALADASAAPAASPTSNPGIRGLYSEYILNPKNAPMLPPLKSPKKAPVSATFKKPPPLKPIAGNYIYTDKSYKPVSEGAIEFKKPKLDYRRALEPKVQLSFETKPGETPRKIEIERKKRLFSTQSIQLLIDHEVKKAFGTKEISNYSQLLNYETFDNTEFEQRTLEEWLDLKMDNAAGDILIPEESTGEWVDKTAPKHILFAKIPIPAVALRRKAWVPCLVVAYDSLQELWKVQWRKNSGWQLEHQADQTDESDFELDEEDIDDTNPNDSERNRKVIWMHRLNILFLAEDPFNFAKRYATALANREDVANLLVT